MNTKKTIPFFVVDRPMSLECLKRCEFGAKKGYYGLMAHANTSKNFQALFRNLNFKNVIKACDSGVFTKQGCLMDYTDLFSIYDFMGTDYGIMIDFLNDREKTVKSAKKAIDVYNNKKYDFRLVGVAQGNNIEEYLECYKDLKNLGFEYIAVGGLLKKNFNSARYVKVKNENFLKEVLQKIREEFKKDWIFALGCYHPRRQRLFDELNIFGADSKGWIFKYKTNNELLSYKTKELNNLEENIAKLRSWDELTLNAKLKSNNEFELLMREYNYKKLICKRLNEMLTEEKRDLRFKQIYSYIYNNIYSQFKDYLLIINCSQRKREIYQPAPALEVYDGPFFRMIRKMINEGLFPQNVHTLIISAKYGTIGLYDLIENYDQTFNENNFKETKSLIYNSMELFINNNQFEEIFLSMGKSYRDCLNEINFGSKVNFSEGRIGEKLSKTKKWLLEKNQMMDDKNIIRNELMMI